MRYNLTTGFETFAGAAIAGATRNIVTQHPSNPVPRTNWFVDGGILAAGFLAEFLGAQTNSRAMHEIGEGFLAPGFAYAVSDLTQLGRNQMAKNAAVATTTTQTQYVGAAAPASVGGGFVSDY